MNNCNENGNLIKKCGFPVDLFVEPPRPRELCPVCMNVFNDPRQCINGHVFCYCCLKRSVEEFKRCPDCNIRMSSKDLENRSQFARETIDELQVRCECYLMRSSERIYCGWTGKLCDMVSRNCSEACVPCANPDCSDLIQRKNIDQHALICSYRTVPCELCSERIQFNQLSAHALTCSERILSCECGEQMSFSSHQTHLTHMCPQFLLTCPFYTEQCCDEGCSGQIKRCDFRDHVADNGVTAFLKMKSKLSEVNKLSVARESERESALKRPVWNASNQSAFQPASVSSSEATVEAKRRRVSNIKNESFVDSSVTTAFPVVTTINTPSKSKTAECMVCGKLFIGGSYDVKRHSEKNSFNHTVSAEKTATHAHGCVKCGLYFTSQENLSSHTLNSTCNADMVWPENALYTSGLRAMHKDRLPPGIVPAVRNLFHITMNTPVVGGERFVIPYRSKESYAARFDDDHSVSSDDDGTMDIESIVNYANVNNVSPTGLSLQAASNAKLTQSGSSNIDRVKSTSHIVVKKYECMICGKCTKTAYDLVRHTEATTLKHFVSAVETDRFHFACTKCGLYFTNYEHLTSHQMHTSCKSTESIFEISTATHISSLPSEILLSDKHLHKLVKTECPYPLVGKFHCDLCDQGGAGWSYHCAECRYDLHPNCAMALVNKTTS